MSQYQHVNRYVEGALRAAQQERELVATARSLQILRAENRHRPHPDCSYRGDDYEECQPGLTQADVHRVVQAGHNEDLECGGNWGGGTRRIFLVVADPNEEDGERKIDAVRGRVLFDALVNTLPKK